jgi:Muconolactone delta-isomerase
MPQYQVTMNLVKTDPLLDIGRLTEIVTQTIVPSLDALMELQLEGKVIAGGHPVGQRYVVLFMEAESEEEVHKLLEGLPLSELGDTVVTELKGFEELRKTGKSSRRRTIL